MYQGNDCMSQISGLLDCYGQVQAATAFIKQVLASTPMALKGVTDGSNPLPGQVGEWAQLVYHQLIGTAETQVLIPLGTLQPGDWDYWFSVTFGGIISLGAFELTPLPVGFSNILYTASFGEGGVLGISLASTIGRALISVPSLVTIQASTQAPVATFCDITFNARRMR